MGCARSDILEIFQGALEGADAGRLMRDQVRLDGETFQVGNETVDLAPFHRVHVMGIGKAAAHMALPLEEILGNRLTGGMVIVKEGYIAPLQRIQVREAGHPIPDIRGLRASEEMISLLKTCREDDLILFLVSGGGSALFVSPESGITLQDKIETTRVLLASGATIGEINAIRKLLSRVKGGKFLDHAHPATIVGLILSDVVGDRLEDIASGPTVLPRMATDLRDIDRLLARYGLRGELPKRVIDHLERISSRKTTQDHDRQDGLSKQSVEVTEKISSHISGRSYPDLPGEGPEPLETGPYHETDSRREDFLPLEPRVRNILIGNNESLLEGARDRARELGYAVHILGRDIQGEAREVAGRLSALARAIREKGEPVKPPACLLAGGETTVTVTGRGLGGRCLEFALASAIALEGEEIIVLAAGSDGTDGPTNAAGAVADGETCRRARVATLDSRDFLRRNDSYTFFEALDDLLITGPTRTNVMDLYAFLVP